IIFVRAEWTISFPSSVAIIKRSVGVKLPYNLVIAISSTNIVWIRSGPFPKQSFRNFRIISLNSLITFDIPIAFLHNYELIRLTLHSIVSPSLLENGCQNQSLD